MNYYVIHINNSFDIFKEPYTQIVERYKAAPKDELRELSKQDDYAFFLERLSYSKFERNHESTDMNSGAFEDSFILM